MDGKLLEKFIILICFVLLVACNAGNTQPVAANLPASNTPQIPVTTTDTPVPTPTITKLPASTPTENVRAPIRVENADGTWYIEFESEWHLSDKVFRIFHSGEAAPFLEVDIFSYFLDHPEEEDVFSTDNSPIMAGWSKPLWSPDGRYLAFLGAVEGPTSDLYVLDTNTEKITRITSGENQAVFPVWSPDSRWILHGEMFDGRGDDGYESYWASRADSSENRMLFHPGGWATFLVWVDDSRFYVYDHTILGAVALRFVDLESGETITVYNMKAYPVVGGMYTEFAIDPQSKAVLYNLVVMPDYPASPYHNNGFYLSTPSNPKQRMVVPPLTGISYSFYRNWDEDLGVFVTRPYCDDDPELYYAVTPEGETYCIEYSGK